MKNMNKWNIRFRVSFKELRNSLEFENLNISVLMYYAGYLTIIGYEK